MFVFGLGITSIMALKLSLATQAFGMTSGALGWSKSFIDKKALLWALTGSLTGMYIGTFTIVPSNLVIKELFGWVSLLPGLVVIIEMRFGAQDDKHKIEKSLIVQTVCYVILCLTGGIVTAWISIGIGEVVALYLLLVYKIRIETAIGTGVTALAVSSIAGLIFHRWPGGIQWEYLAFTAPGVLVGGNAGSRLGKKLERLAREKKQVAVHQSQLNGSPLRWIFVIIAFADGTAMLLQAYMTNPL